MIARWMLEIPGFPRTKFETQAACLAFWKVTAPAVAGRGLIAKLWAGKRHDAEDCERWSVTPILISIDQTSADLERQG